MPYIVACADYSVHYLLCDRCARCDIAHVAKQVAFIRQAATKLGSGKSVEDLPVEQRVSTHPGPDLSNPADDHLL